MEPTSYLISAEARSTNPSPSSDLADSHDDRSPRSRRSLCFRVLAWPCGVVASVGHAIGIGFKLVFIVLSLALYSFLLMPGFLRMTVYYFFSKNVVRGIVYGPKPRQRLDMYFPPDARNGATYPVVIYITGGAWTIGYRAWGALLARRLSEQGVLVACLDYRNFPQGDALDMLEDVNTGISWVLSRIHRYGGDLDSVTLVGQSAGGHLAGLALIKQAEQAACGSPSLGATPSWSPACLRAFVGVSGAFDLEALATHRGGHFRGLLDRILALDVPEEEEEADQQAGAQGGGDKAEGGEAQGDGLAAAVDGGPQLKIGNGEEEHGLGVAGGAAVAGGSGGGVRRQPPPRPVQRKKRPAYEALSPLAAARRLSPVAAGMLPYVLLIHGTADKTVPAESSSRLSEALRVAGAPNCYCELVPGKTHTAFLLEDPMRGGRDLLSNSVLSAVLGARPPDMEEGRSGGNGGGGAVAAGGGGADVVDRVYGSLCPGFLCDLAGMVTPF